MLTASLLSISVSFSALAASDEALTRHDIDWSFEGVFGTFDKAALQRGFQVYREVCASCHSLDYIAFRNLADLGYNEAEIKSIAAEYDITDGPDEEGAYFTRPGLPSDRFPAPFANENEARAANNGAYPPDLSLMYKARADGANYLYSLLVSYKEPPADMDMPEGMYYDTAYAGHLIAMPQPLYGDDVVYADGADSSIEGEAKDLVHFLAWTAEPTLEKRKRTGIAVMLFLIILTGLTYGAMRFVWADVK